MNFVLIDKIYVILIILIIIKAELYKIKKFGKYTIVLHIINFIIIKTKLFKTKTIIRLYIKFVLNITVLLLKLGLSIILGYNVKKKNYMSQTQHQFIS